MRVPLSWLHDYCAPEVTTGELAERLDMSGTQVERILLHGVGSTDLFVVGKVLAADRHPDADRLTVCRVDVGGEQAQIVCGAPNVAAGQTVAVARPGAVMPGGTKLGTAKLRGVESAGMILAEDELGIGPDHAGILVLDDGVQAGAPLADVLPIATEVLELEVTSNRPDCLGVYGVAREVHAVTGAPLAEPPWSQDPGSSGDVEGVQISVECPDLCPRFTARVFDDVKIGPSPPWLKARLSAAGQRPINNVVDITNYVMLMTAQPLHAFDLDRVADGRLVVRRAQEGEKVETLDGSTRTLDSEMVVIDDADGPTSIAGVMGGARSEVADDTRTVLMEVANWIGPNIHRTSLRLGLRSEASGRFEKQLAPEQTMDAQAVVAQLMTELCGATLRPGTVDVDTPRGERPVLHLRDARVSRILGVEVPRVRSTATLNALGFETTEAGDGLDAAVPYWRRVDVYREIDLVEEVARIGVVEELPSTLPSPKHAGGLTEPQRLRRRVEDSLTGGGANEIAGWSFTSAAAVERLRLGADDPRAAPVRVTNPMSAEQAVMRTMLLGSLLDSSRYNAARGAHELRLFETGAVYRDERGADGLPHERRHVAALITGSARPRTWRDPEPPPADAFAAKALLVRVLDALRLDGAVSAAQEPFLRPGRGGEVTVGGERVGWVGDLHPAVTDAWDLEPAAAFEIDLDAVVALAVAAGSSIYREVTAFPAVHQDIAVVVGDDVPAARVLEVARKAGGELLEAAEVFDVYTGEQVGEGQVSLALRLAFHAPDRTLTEEEASERREAIAAAIADELGGTLRA